MNKIKLTDKEKLIITKLIEDNYLISEDDSKELEHLIYLGIGKGMQGEFGGYFDYELTDKAKAYLFENPKLKNPSIFDDTKFWLEFISNII